MFFYHYKIEFIILNSYEHFKLVKLNTQLNPVEEFRTKFSSDSSVSYHLIILLNALSNHVSLYTTPFKPR